MDGEISTSGNGLVHVRAENRTGWSKARRKLFLHTLMEVCNVRTAARAADASVSSVYRLRRRDAAFARLWQDALEIGYERLEEMLLARALVGVNAIEIGSADAADHDASGRDGADLPSVGGAAPFAGGTASLHPKGGGFHPATGLSARRFEPVDVQIAMWLLNRHRATVKNGAPVGTRAAATQEETDAALERKLDMLERRLKRTA